MLLKRYIPFLFTITVSEQKHCFDFERGFLDFTIHIKIIITKYVKHKNLQLTKT